MIRSFRLVLTAFLVIATVPAGAFALAQNTVRVDDFKWMQVQTEHFDIYYDKKDEMLVPRMAHHVENAWREVGEKFNHNVPGRTPFFFYSDHNRFEQTNIVPIGEGTGGVTEAFKNRLIVFNDGSDEWLRHVIYHEFVHVLEFSMLYAGPFRSVQLVVKSPFYPLWMMEGMAEYGSGDVDLPATSMVIRDAVANDILPDLAELHGFGHLKPGQVTLGYKTGEAAIRFMADEYGKESVHDVLAAMREHFDIASALEEVLHTDLTRFNFRFREWTTDRLAADIARASRPETHGKRVTPKDRIPQFNEAPAFSPDGGTLYYMSDRDGPTRAFELDLATGRDQPLFGIDWSEFENLHTDSRGLSVSPDGRWLAFCGEKEQRDFLYIYDLKRRRLKRIRVPFDQIRSAEFSPVDNNRLVVVALINGYTDLILMDRDGNTIRRLTNTPQYEAAPSFSPDGSRVLFSGETLTQDGSQPAGRDIFSLDMESLAAERIVSLKGTESEPEALPDGTLVFVRDEAEDGWQGLDLFRLKPGATEPERLTRMVGGAFSPRYVPATGKLYFVAFNAGERQVYEGNWDFSPSTPVVTALPDDAGEADLDEPEPTRIVSTWPEEADSPLFKAPPSRYRFKGSTDLFIPFFLYSTDGGLAAVYYWQYSDMLGNHVIQQQAQYASGADYYDVAAFYTYGRYRPQFTVGAQAERYYRDFDEQEQRREIDGVLAMTYPFDRINAVTLGIGSTHRRDVFLDDSFEDERFQDRYAFAGLAHDTVTGRYLVPVRGRRLSIVYQQGFERLGGNQQYRSALAEATQYVPLPRESTVAGRLIYGRSVGDDPQVFRLGGRDRVRALSDSDANKKTNAVLASAELRLRMKYLDARTAFLFPDFFFKAAYLSIFDDAAFGWDSRAERRTFGADTVENSAGVGVFWPTYILQSFKLDLGVTWARRTTDGSDTWYVTVGPSY